MKRVIALVLAVVLLVGCIGFASAEEDYGQYLGYGDVSTSEELISSIDVDMTGLYADLVEQYEYIAILYRVSSSKDVWSFIGSSAPMMVCSQGYDTGTYDCSYMMISASNDAKYAVYNASSGYLSTELETLSFDVSYGTYVPWSEEYYAHSAYNTPVGFSYYGFFYGVAGRAMAYHKDIKIWTNYDVVDLAVNEVILPANLNVAVDDYEHYIGVYQGVKCLYIPCLTAPTSLPITVTLGDGTVINFDSDTYQFVPSLGGNDLSYAVIPLYDLSSDLSFVIWQSTVNMYGDVLICNTELVVDNFVNADITDKLTGTNSQLQTPNTEFPLDDMLHYYTETLPNSGEITSKDTVLSFLYEVGLYESKYGISLNIGYIANINGVVNWFPYEDSVVFLHNLPELVENYGDDVGASALLATLLYDVVIYRYYYSNGDDIVQDYYSIYLTPLYYARQITTIQQALSVISNRFAEMYELMYNQYYTDVQFLKEFMHSISEVNRNLSNIENSLVAELKELRLYSDISAVESLLMQILYELQGFEFSIVDFVELKLPDWLVAVKDFVVDFIALPITATGQSVGVIADGITWIFNFYTSTDGSGFIEVDENGNPSISVDLENSGGTGYLPVLEE